VLAASKPETVRELPPSYAGLLGNLVHQSPLETKTIQAAYLEEAFEEAFNPRSKVKARNPHDTVFKA
jgi:hypothetical protein